MMESKASNKKNSHYCLQELILWYFKGERFFFFWGKLTFSCPCSLVIMEEYFSMKFKG